MAEIRANIEIEVTCAKCNTELKSSTRRGTEIYIEPCEACLLDEYNRGYNEGKEEEG